MLSNYFKRGAGFILLLVFLLTACEQQKSPKATYPMQISDWALGTSYSIKASKLPDKLAAAEVQQAVETLLAELNGQMSTYLPDSELSQINASRSTAWIPISEPLFTVLKEAQRVSELSGGAFDITVGPLVNLWGFGPGKDVAEPPTDAAIAARLQNTGYRNLLLQDSPRAVKKLKPELYLDLSAIAKGYIVDRVAQLLETKGVNDYMVEIGGEIQLKGHNAEGQPWRIGIEKPTPDERMVQKVLPVSNTGVATSGDYRNYFEKDDTRYSHTIDPKTGRPIAHKLASITVLRPTTMEADALATALMVLGPEAGFDLAQREGIAALFIIKSDAGFSEKSTAAFEQLMR